MNLKNALLVPATALVALGLMAVPTDAQQRRGNGDRGGGAPQQRATPRQAQPGAGGQQPRSHGQQAQPRSYGYGQQMQPRSYGQQVQPRSYGYGQQMQPRSYGRQVQPRSYGYGQQVQPRSNGYGQQMQPRSYGQQVQPRSYGYGQQVQPRSYGQAVPRQGSVPRAYDRSYYDNRGYAGRAPYYGPAPRTGYGYGYGGYGHGGYDHGGYGYGGYGHGGYGYGAYNHGGYGYGGYGYGGYGYGGYGYAGYGYGYGRGYRPYYYSRPYYAFRPRLSLGFGLWIGFPVAYPFYSYGYANPTYGYPLSSFGLAPGVAYGGISFEIEPHDAAIYVDGDYVGIANDFGPNAQPLTLRAGAHHVEIQATAYAPVVWEVEVIAGQVIPYRGAMQAD